MSTLAPIYRCIRICSKDTDFKAIEKFLKSAGDKRLKISRWKYKLTGQPCDVYKELEFEKFIPVTSKNFQYAARFMSHDPALRQKTKTIYFPSYYRWIDISFYDNTHARKLIEYSNHLLDVASLMPPKFIFPVKIHITPKNEIVWNSERYTEKYFKDMYEGNFSVPPDGRRIGKTNLYSRTLKCLLESGLFNNQPKKEILMNTEPLRITTHIKFNGADITDRGVDYVLGCIQEERRKVEELKKIGIKSATIDLRLSKLEQNIVRMVEILDEKSGVIIPGEEVQPGIAKNEVV